ncbi:LysR family transcriptional regulator [Endozoicomonas numazuensis]|uniref:LysR substrate-binding domain-containing protein n=1 Tax=Endozoicomonas numazuensis TaxID=1137799 RepID=A0A081MZ91_9GAMM|nr:LysR family transcriptional regulator [Endozoicomonas numazuensis]KEQ11514.1 hypothetical protein GZ78_28980 [Endozoicomonas numazuensis]
MMKYLRHMAVFVQIVESGSISQAALAKAGAGVALIPDFLCAPLQEKSQLVNILPEYTFSSVPVYAIHAFGHQPPVLVKRCISAIKEEITDLSKASRGIDG